MQGRIRIIGGKWRGKRLMVPNVAALRPTPDRIRETIFNWLSPYLLQAHCLDLFAGSGVLGLEALSRGAASATLVDSDSKVIHALHETITALHANDVATVYQAVLPQGLSVHAKPFNIVFIDPPYDALLCLPMSHHLEQLGILADVSYIYLEAREEIEDNQLPKNWTMIKSRKAGQVRYHLAKREKA